jgi:hypothetical protein
MSGPLARLWRCCLGALCLLLLALGSGGAEAAMSGTRANATVVGPVIGWGSNSRGQLGANPSARIARPMLVNDLGDVIAVAAGADHSLALLRDGTVRAWGANDAGQLGDGTTFSRALPVVVGGWRMSLPSPRVVSSASLYGVMRAFPNPLDKQVVDVRALPSALRQGWRGEGMSPSVLLPALAQPVPHPPGLVRTSAATPQVRLGNALE